MREYSLKELEEWNERIEACATRLGLDCFPQEFEICSYEEMLGYEAYIGMPSHYPHWSYGKAFDRLHTLYRYQLTGLPYEMVINSDPCLAYLMRDNNLLLQILTMAHVYGHNDFFKNNRLFQSTRPELTVETFQNHARRIRNYIQDPSIGYQKVERILDAAHAVRYQINRVIGVRRLTPSEQKERLIADYRRQVQAAKDSEAVGTVPEPDLDRIPLEPEDDLLWFLAEHAQLAEWERDIIRIVREEAAYFLPQIETKILNEGWASFWHYRILNQLELPAPLHLEFLKRHHQVIRPHRGSLNPYHLGFTILTDLERRFGSAKLFEARAVESDRSLIRRYLTRELCDELHLFEFLAGPDGAVITEVPDEKGWEAIRETLSATVGLGAVPVIRAMEVDPKDRTLLLEHESDARELELGYAGETLKYLVEIWGHAVHLKTKIQGREKTIICTIEKKLMAID
ncbi:stage V sporulation protein R [Hydrogenispora ethanolica]|jgi:stage V sporulation protein R|uniref:Stage V sporulation protein R n=1 Tax=Hydrogenispora ethanolica TaxID=1082276 RepID=A0A4R1RWP2_HYDET|nr:SpoVR family protein [Hydrogenispora ethanolica]TCL70874.1 stage V sporulation protein R [Hydrogenispora ethanolica]